MSKRDPWTAAGAIYIPSDYAPVPPVPAGTKLGNVQEMADDMETFHRALVQLTKDPAKLREAVSSLTAQWTPDQFDNEIIEDLKARAITHPKTNRRGRSGSSAATGVARARARRRSTGKASRFHSTVTAWIDHLRHRLHYGLDRKTLTNPS
ncbi:hypothetical protein [Nocardia iowensis]|uniref:Transposase n=1 Tax=Nocardia iowensis TaxID=204891 RepID=A0ABX8RU80_NOCIO|nr:hypothetical protein [Nocardia iowensis]QXN93187.1 hypothetical protein KV110_08845 [Nocardia iowensis]